ncbi:hypothetical protein CGSSp18BS74_08215, partial [Streptococcus pneumoniae SP18-BS74]
MLQDLVFDLFLEENKNRIVWNKMIVIGKITIK